MMCKVLPQGLKEAVSRKYPAEGMPVWGNDPRVNGRGRKRAGSSLNPEKWGGHWGGGGCPLLQGCVVLQSRAGSTEGEEERTGRGWGVSHAAGVKIPKAENECSCCLINPVQT